MTSTLVTGSSGWVGTHLRRILTDRGFHVVGLGRNPVVGGCAESYVLADLRDPDKTTSTVTRVRPDIVFHLAASTPQRAPDVTTLVADCALTTYNVCTALRTAADAHDYRPRLILAGSSAQYGAVPREDNPISEQTPTWPSGAYGRAKVAAEELALAMAADGRISVTAARPFNHVGPGERPTTVAGALARRVADVVVGRAKRVHVMNLDVVRDYTDVRDIARAYIELAEKELPNNVYNICSNRAVTVRMVLERLLDVAGLDWSIVEATSSTGEVPFQVGSPHRLESQTQWKAEIPLSQSLRELLGEVMAEAADDGARKGTAWRR